MTAPSPAGNGPSPRRLGKYVTGPLRLKQFFRAPGDGRRQPPIPAQALYWSLLISPLLRECRFPGVEAVVGSPAHSALPVRTSFGDDALGYCTERLDAEATRQAAAPVIIRAKRNQAFDPTAFIGLALDGATGARCRRPGCPLCRPVRHPPQPVVGYRHHWAMISVVGTGLALPFDVELYGPMLAAAQKRFRGQLPQRCFQDGQDRVEVRDAADFDSWETWRWETVRVLRYRQYKPDGEGIEAYWLTHFSWGRVGSRTLYRLPKSRWEIEGQGFNEAKNRRGREHICHHEPNSLWLQWRILVLALTIERLYRLRYLHRGAHPVRTAMELVRLLRLCLARPARLDSS